ncbi:arylsulfatase [Candidatus Pelagisphaera phototrophica]|uniref:arylsulfatase n=1 Tax=Candidatus Pelagisphaera phototrophica TaxID=2684113 RepID=UPI001A0C81BB|nr:arylsulfatase [Candidatus Pelagisphaera phototrophica]QXD32959.1 arylsulfatase [Candidatus Pelagisphaera phototrophica]
MKSWSLSLLFLLLVPTANGATKPNVVIILTDDQGWGDLSIHGNTNLDTPNIDRLANEGIEFSNFYVCPICSPTRAEFLTGRYNPRGGVRSASRGEERLDLDEVTIAEIFRDNGYKTAAFGKWHNGMQPPYHPNARGFDEYYGFCSGHWGNYYSPMLEHNGEIVKGDGFVIDDFTNRAMDFIETNKDEPFFVYLPYNTPHSPMQVPGRFWKKFEDNDLGLRARPEDKEDLQHSRAALAMCENIDWNVGRVTRKLEDLGLSENTIVIYFSDNGPNGYRWNADMKGRKGSVDEGGVRSPFFIRWPEGLEGGRTIDRIAGTIDLLPTLTDLAGIEKYRTLPLDGVSLRPLMLRNGVSWPDRLYVNHFKGKTSIRNQRFRLDQNGKLYDMDSDPGQRRDVSRQFPDVLKRMVAAQTTFDRDVASLVAEPDNRPFTIGHPVLDFTQIPARDGQFAGGVERSGRAPNCSFFTNWTQLEDRIFWDAEVLTAGDYKVEVYYTCPEDDVGSTFELAFGTSRLKGEVTEAFDNPMRGAVEDRAVRKGESYVKEFKAMDMGVIQLKKGRNRLELKALDIPGNQVMEVRLLMFHRVDS